MGGLAQRVQQTNVARQEQPNLTPEDQVRESIKRRLPTIKALLPDVLDERKLAALVVTEVYKTPALAACSEESLIGCVLRAAALGLQFGQDLGQAFLIPRGRDCTLQIGYKGVIALAMRSGAIKSISTRCVHKGDTFSYAYGLNEHLDHVPALVDDRSGREITHAYAVVRYTNGGTDFEVLDRAQIEARRKRGKGAQPAWQTDYAKMAEKSAILAMRARLPLTTEVATALAQDGAAIAVSSRGPATLVATHDTPAIEPGPGVADVEAVYGRSPRPDPETGEVAPPADDEPTDPDPEPPSTHEPAPLIAGPQEAPPHSAAIGDKKGQAVHAGPLAKVPAALHGACILRASGGATWHARDLLSRQVPTVAVYAEDATTDPAGFARETLELVKVETDEAVALRAWLAAQT